MKHWRVVREGWEWEGGQHSTGGREGGILEG